jgi:hypothetical protein
MHVILEIDSMDRWWPFLNFYFQETEKVFWKQSIKDRERYSYNGSATRI